MILGDRYGWQPLAESITEDEFQELEKAALELSGEARCDSPASLGPAEVLRIWYRRNDNAVPVEYSLRSRNDWQAARNWSEEREKRAGRTAALHRQVSGIGHRAGDLAWDYEVMKALHSNDFGIRISFDPVPRA